MNEQLRILLISSNEICYNTRLLKAADYFSEQGCIVCVFNPITGIATESVYRNAILNKNWILMENDISKRNFSSWLRWLYISIINRSIGFLWNHFRLKIGFKYYMNKGLWGAYKKISGKFDFILIHLVDNLPFAAYLKKRTGARLIYDSQEYFSGQYNKYAKNLKDWVALAESEFISDTDILIATTNVMLQQLKKDYQLSIPALRVRNLPSKKMLQNIPLGIIKDSNDSILLLVWHGMTIYFNNTRGVHILLRAIANCKTKVHLYLQGLINQEQKKIFDEYIKELDLSGKVSIIPPANPYNIVESLVKYDIGLIAELPQEENQMLTSSNKLFDFINAGLVVISSDLPGLNETIKEYKVGYSYPSGDFLKLAELIDSLGTNRNLLISLKRHSKEVAQKELFWENDYKEIWSCMQAKK
jgi:glycosyltransferase involved in cell wall biosynthesis